MQMLIETKVTPVYSGAWWKMWSKWVFEKGLSSPWECNRLGTSCFLLQFWKEILNSWNIWPGSVAANVSFNYVENTVLEIQKIRLFPVLALPVSLCSVKPLCLWCIGGFYRSFSVVECTEDGGGRKVCWLQTPCSSSPESN